MKISDFVSDEKIYQWGEFEGVGFEVQYIARPEHEAALKKCEKTVYRKHQPVVEVDIEKQMAYYAGLIRNWTLTYGDLRKFFNINSSVKPDSEDFPASEDNKIFMIDNAYGFAKWLLEYVIDIQNFQDEKIEDEKKIT